MSIFSTFYLLKPRWGLIGVMVLSFLAMSAPVDAKKILFDDRLGTVVIDPGHGGNDQGASGPSGTLEKNVTLALARLIARELESDFRVILTRTDDYGLDLFKRTGTANNKQADLFISLHTSASFLHNAKGLTIFYYQGASLNAYKDDPPASAITNTSHPPWHEIQDRHVTQSAFLAEMIQKQLLAQATFIESKLQKAPLVVLQGADMPAVLIEIGYLTNPIEEKTLNDQATLADYARGISRGIQAFFRK